MFLWCKDAKTWYCDGKKTIITLPPLAEQKRIVKAIETIFAQLDEISNAIA